MLICFLIRCAKRELCRYQGNSSLWSDTIIYLFRGSLATFVWQETSSGIQTHSWGPVWIVTWQAAIPIAWGRCLRQAAPPSHKPNTPSKVESQSQTRIYARSLDTTHAGIQNAHQLGPTNQHVCTHKASNSANLIHDKPILRRAAYKVTATSLQYHTYSSI